MRVEYDVVRAAVTSGITARPKAPSRVTTPAVHAAPVRRESRRFLARASRALVGDGRYRPSPFPRPDTR